MFGHAALFGTFTGIGYKSVREVNPNIGDNAARSRFPDAQASRPGFDTSWRRRGEAKFNHTETLPHDLCSSGSKAPREALNRNGETDVLLQILYTSDATEQFRASSLADILRVSRKNNQMSNITGVLLHVDGHFLQVLEGPEDHVRQRYETISRANRHRNCCVVHQQALDKRTFPNWSMGSRDVNALSTSGLAIRALRSAKDITSVGRNKSEILQLWLEAFSEAHLDGNETLEVASAALVHELQ